MGQMMQTPARRPSPFTLLWMFSHGGGALYVSVCVAYDICNVGRVGNVWSLTDVWYVPSAFSGKNQNKRSS